jgi:hypothetical protein
MPPKAKKPAKWLTPKQELKVIISMLDNDSLIALRSYARFVHLEKRVNQPCPKGGDTHGQRSHG